MKLQMKFRDSASFHGFRFKSAIPRIPRSRKITGPTVHKEAARRVDGAALCKCHQGVPHHPTLGHAQDMAEVTEAALANRTNHVLFWGCCRHSVVLASDYVQAAALETVHTAHHWLSERPRFRCVCQRRTHSKLVRPQLQRARQPVVCPYAGE